MLKYIKKVIFLVILPVLFWFISTEILLRNIPNDYKIKAEALNTNGNNFQFISLGSSNAFYGIIPKRFDLKGINLANVSQSANYDLFLLKKSVEKCDSLKFVIFPLTFPTFFYDIANIKEFWRVTNYNIYFDGDFKKYDPKYNFITYNTNLKSPFKRIFKYYIQGVSERTCDDLGFGMREDPSDNSDMDIYGPLYGSWHEEMYDSLEFEENIKGFKEIVSICKKKNIKLIIPYIPACKSYSSNLDTAYLNPSRRIVEKIAESNNHVYYFDMINDSRFKREDFYDPNHLGKLGAKKFSDILNIEINKLNKK